MAFVQADIDICNLALQWLGAKPVADLDNSSETSVRKELCILNYPRCQKAVLEVVMWTFATGRVVLDTVDEIIRDLVLPFGAGNVFEIPADVLRVHRIYRDASLTELIPSEQWNVEGNYIIADVDPAFCHVLIEVPDPANYTTLFEQALAAYLAATICIPLTENTKLHTELWQKYESTVGQAASTEGKQGTNEKFRAERLTRVR